MWSVCQCSLPCCITGTSPSSAIWQRVTGTLAASEDPPCSSPQALTTSSVHRAESQPVNSSIFLASWFLLYLFFCYHISWLVFVCSWPLSGLIQIWPFLLGSMGLYCSLFWNVTRLDFWIGSSHAALHFFHNEKKRIVYLQFICKTTFMFQHVRHVRAQCSDLRAAVIQVMMYACSTLWQALRNNYFKYYILNASVGL